MGKKIGLVITVIIILGTFSIDLSNSNTDFSNSNTIMNSFDAISLSILWEKGINLEQGSPHYADLNGDGYLDIVIPTSTALYCVNGRTGETIWSQSLVYEFISTPCIVDIDNDSRLEIIIQGGYYSDTIYCFDYEGNLEWYNKISADYGTYPFHTSPPCIGDQDLDGIFEIIVGTRYGILCINSDDLSRWEFTTDNEVHCSPALLNVDSDSEYEIVFTCYDGYLYCVDDEGDLYWKTALIEEFSTISSPVICDVDLDGKPEIYIGTGDRFCSYDSDGNLLWSITPTSGDYGIFEGSPVIANIDNKGPLEILTQSSFNKLYCISSEGFVNWTYDIESHTEISSVVLSDLTGDGNQEIIVVSDDITCLSFNGTVLDTHPINYWSFSNPLVGDLNLDGRNEIFCSEYLNNVKCFTIGSAQESGISVWPCFLGSNYHTGFGDYDGDMLDEFTEKFYGTNKTNSDTDSDGFLDGWEVMVGLNPLVNDTWDDLDTDNLSNYDEVRIYHTSVFTADTDGDGVSDGDEVLLGRDPLVDDNDNSSTTPIVRSNFSFVVPVNTIYTILFATIIMITLSKKKWKKL